MRPFLHRAYRFLRRTYLLYVVPAVLVLFGAVALADWMRAPPDETAGGYVGRGKCMQCHQAEYHRWHGSHHDKAMDKATAETVLGNFDDQQFTYNDITSRFSREGDQHFVTTDGPDGKLKKYEVKYTFGVEPLQQYMVQMERGRVQVLPFCWDTQNKRWFHLYQAERQPVHHDDPLHWTKPGQNWNHVCADCHSTNLQKNYDNATDTFNTTYSEIDVSCEACHGPGEMHVWLAENKWMFWDRNHGYGLHRLKGPDATNQIETCAQCHSHRNQIYPDYHAGHRFLDHYVPALLDTGLYHHDGQIDHEVYVHGSFQQSKMYSKGVRCSDCHDPHSTKVKFTGNQLCTQCHEHSPAKYDTPLHHHHKPGSAGSLCVECHMPAKKYMVVDPRRDHSLRVPRPDLSVLLGTPNACTGCHVNLDADTYKEKKLDKWPDYQDWQAAAGRGDETAKAELAKLDEWATGKVTEWFPTSKHRSQPHYALTLAAALRDELEAGAKQKGDRRDEIEEIVARLLKLARRSSEAGPIVRASAVSLLGNYGTAETAQANQAALEDRDPLVRLSAVQNLMTFYGVSSTARWDFDNLPGNEQQRAVRQMFGPLWQAASPLLDDPVRAIRFEAARVLSLVPEEFLEPSDRQRLAARLKELEAGYLSSGDQYATQVNLAQLFAAQGSLKKAEAAYLTSLERMPYQIPARTGLANLYIYQKRYDEAEKRLREALKIADQHEGDSLNLSKADLHYQLGRLLASSAGGQLRQGAGELAKAIELAPNFAIAQYAFATALRDLGDTDAAEYHYRLAYERMPLSTEFRDGLASIYQVRLQGHAAQRRWSQALRYAEKMVQLMPENEQFQKQLTAIRQRLR